MALRALLRAAGFVGEGLAAPSRRVVDGRLERLSAPLRADVRRLTSILGRVITESGGPRLLDDIERLRRATIEVRESRGADSERLLSRAVDLVAGFDLAHAESVARAFTVYFHLVNLAEERHRVRILRRRGRARRPVSESLAATLGSLRSEAGEPGLESLLARLEIRPVLTAHPTEARRRAVVDALNRISRAMDVLDDARLTASERARAELRLEEEIAILWRTSPLRRLRPTPLDEVRSMMTVFDEALFYLVPVVYRTLEQAMAGEPGGLSAGSGPAAVPTFLRWGSWIGGDRDGNPHVTAAVTAEALRIQATHALLGLEAATRRIGRSLTVSAGSTPPSEALLGRLAAARAMTGSDLVAAEEEPHRAAMLVAAARLAATRLDQGAGYDSSAEFVADLLIVQGSLAAAGAGRLAAGEIQNLIWQAGTFGFHFASLEVRQHSSVHREVVRELVPEALDDAPRLDAIAAGDVPPIPAEISGPAREVLDTLRTMHSLRRKYGPQSCRRYIVSFTHSAADLVAVSALARLALPDAEPEIEVVPLFESRADLEAAPRVLDELLRLPGWLGRLEAGGRRLEVMLGYSDATKDAGFLAANLSLYRAQSALVAWARRHSIDLIVFHGRGGALGRGGGPAGRAIRSQAPGSIGGRFKVTEQGEVIFARYGNPAIALRHLEQVTSAVLTSSSPRHQRALERAERRYAADAELMAARSEAAYRNLVEAPGFGEFFARVTPLEEIGRLALGSRPASRSGASVRSLDQLRAIPWGFAWTQNRCNLTGWFGLGSGLQAVVDARGLDHLRRMAAEWPLMASVIDNAEMSLAKADPVIAGRYLARGARTDLVDAIREEYRLTRSLLLAARGHQRLLAGHPILRLAVDLRNPYVDALSLLQLRFMDELERSPRASREQLSALVRLTISGIAAGLQNTG